MIARLLSVAVFCLAFLARGSELTINSNNVFVMNGKRIFPISVSSPPPADGTAPSGRNAIQELAFSGINFARTGVRGVNWDEDSIKSERQYEDVCARYGVYCIINLRDLASIGAHATNRPRELFLRRVVNEFKNHPGLGAWKSVDEPEWGNHPIEPMLRARDILRELDPHHPIVVLDAPRGEVEDLRRYLPAGDVTGADIYPIGYPPGADSQYHTNTEISLVGDYTRKMIEVAQGRQPVWMVLQIAWSGVLKPGKTLRMPTFPEERFMTYEAIINGTRAVQYFGGDIEKAMAPEDIKSGWNWTFWQSVLRPVVEEIGARSPLYPALLEPDSKLPVKVIGSGSIEFCVRETGRDVFVLACQRGLKTEKVEFSGLPVTLTGGPLLYESPRRVEIKDGRFKDWFGPFEVHVYRFTRR